MECKRCIGGRVLGESCLSCGWEPAVVVQDWRDLATESGQALERLKAKRGLSTVEEAIDQLTDDPSVPASYRAARLRQLSRAQVTVH